jgi:hypothetical protein
MRSALDGAAAAAGFAAARPDRLPPQVAPIGPRLADVGSSEAAWMRQLHTGAT